MKCVGLHDGRRRHDYFSVGIFPNCDSEAECLQAGYDIFSGCVTSIKSNPVHFDFSQSKV